MSARYFSDKSDHFVLKPHLLVYKRILNSKNDKPA